MMDMAGGVGLWNVVDVRFCGEEFVPAVRKSIVVGAGDVTGS